MSLKTQLLLNCRLKFQTKPIAKPSLLQDDDDEDDDDDDDDEDESVSKEVKNICCIEKLR